MSLATILGSVAASVIFSFPPEDFSTVSDLSVQFDTPVDYSGSPLTYQMLNNNSRNTSVKKFGSASMLSTTASGVDSCVQLASNIDFSNGDFTIEMFVALSGEPPTSYFAGRWGASGNRSWQMIYDSTSNQIRFLCSTDGAATFGTANYDLDTDGVSIATFFDGNMHHIAVVRNGTTITVYIDGDPGAGTVAISTNSIYNGGTNYTYIGGTAVGNAALVSGDWAGYMDEVRISNSARYTSSFTPPTSAFTSDGNTKVLFHFDENFGVTQSGVVTNPVVFVNYAAQGAGPFDVYGLMVKSGFTAPYIASDAHFGFGSGNFTIEAFGLRSVSGTAWGTTLRQLCGCWSTTAGQRAWRIILSTSTTFQFEYSTDGSTTAATVTFTGIAPVADTNYNLAVVRSGSNLYLYCNGVRVNSASISGTLFDPSSISLPLGILSGMTVSIANSNACATTTRIHGLRTLKGLARYQNPTYTVPTFPLP